MEPLILLTAVAIAAIIFFGGLIMVAKFYRKVNQGQALIINRMKDEPEVTFTGGIVIPIIHRAEVMDISVKTVEIERRGEEGLICKDNIRADIKVAFFVRVNKTKQDVLKVAQAIGCLRASDKATMEELFVAKFSEALKTVGKRLDFEQLYTQREAFKDQIIEIIGHDLNGYSLEDAAIDFVEQTPLQSLDIHNILDSQGIRKITEITAAQSIATNDLRQEERKAITRKNVEADESILELERRKADAEAKQRREIDTMRAREAAETAKVQAEERQRSESAGIKADEELAIQEIAKQRQIQVADKDRERVVAIKTEQVSRDRELEVITREREVELRRIAKEKELEVQRKEIADVVRSRIAVDKTVAEEEERIKDLRVHAEASRKKDVKVINAEAEAEEKLVKEIKAAEAHEKVSEFQARQRLVLANAELEASERETQAKIRLADGTKAQEAASGLAQAHVQEVQAIAIEKQGLAKVRVREADVAVSEREGLVKATIIKQTLLSEAAGSEEKGLVEARVQEAHALARLKEGEAEGSVIKERLLAEAEGKKADALAVKELLLAQATGKEADAVALERLGEAEAKSIFAKMKAEANGLLEKTAALQKLEGNAREHEEFRLNLEKSKEIELASIAMKEKVAKAQAEVLAGAFEHSDIKIVGGDGQFFDKFIKATTLGQSIDGVVDNSSTVQKVFGDYLEGEKSLPEDMMKALASVGSDASSIRDLSVSAFLAKISSDPKLRDGIIKFLSERD